MSKPLYVLVPNYSVHKVVGFYDSQLAAADRAHEEEDHVHVEEYVPRAALDVAVDALHRYREEHAEYEASSGMATKCLARRALSRIAAILAGEEP